MHVQEGVDVDTVVAQVLDSLAETSGVVRAGLALTEGGGRRLRFTASDQEIAYCPGEPVRLAWCDIDGFADVPLTAVICTGEPVVGTLALLAERYPDFVRGQRARGVAAVAALPLTLGTSVVGGIVLFYDLPQRFGPHQLAGLQGRAARASADIAAARTVVDSRADAGEVHARVDEGPVAILEVDGVPASVAVARRFARRRMQEWQVHPDVLDTAVLCLSELVTNVVMHSGASARIELRPDGRSVVVTVRNEGASASIAPADDDADPLRVHGRGLQLIEALADEWGTESDSSGTTVWCSIGMVIAAGG